MRIEIIRIAVLAGLTAGCGAQRHAGPVAANPVEPERKTVEFTEKSQTDIQRRMEQWQQDGWAVNSFSARLPQPDGTIHRRVELSRAAHPAVNVGYDDQRIARILLGETDEDELIEWFGHPESRTWNADRRMSLAWSFSTPASSADGSGVLNVSLGPDGTVESYNAHRTVEKHATASSVKYDDQLIAGIGHGETSESQLVQWFGRPIIRETKMGQGTSLAWQFANKTADGTAASGALRVNLAPDGKAVAYAAHRTSDAYKPVTTARP